MTRRRAGQLNNNTDRTAAADDSALREGMAAIEHRRPDEAERIARELLGRRPQRVGALHLLGLALLTQRRAREPVAPLEQAALAGSDPVVETHYAVALREVGRRAEALD